MASKPRKVLITGAKIHDDYVSLEYDKVNGIKTNFQYTAAVVVEFVSIGEMTEKEFKDACISKIMNIP